MALHLCASCARHVKTAEEACPFCGSSSFAPVPRPVSRATRAAMVFGSAVMVSAAAACSDTSAVALYGTPVDPSEQDASTNALYGVPAADSSVADAADAGTDGDAGQDASPVALYGGFPVDAAGDAGGD